MSASDDKYCWLEPPLDRQALAWAAEHTAQSKAALRQFPSYSQLRAELDELLKQNRRAPELLFVGDKLLRLRVDIGHPHGILELGERDGQGLRVWRPVFDVGAFNAAEGCNYTLQTALLPKFALPPNYDRCLLSLAPAGVTEVALREFDLANGAFVDDGFCTSTSYTQAVWLAEDRLLIAHTLGDAPRSSNGRAARAFLWHRGTSIQDARPVLTLDPTDSMMLLFAVNHGSARRAVLVRVHDYGTCSIAIIDPEGRITESGLPGKLKYIPFLAATERHFVVQLAVEADVAGERYPAETLLAYDTHPDTSDDERIRLVGLPGEDEFVNRTLFGCVGTRTAFHFIAERHLRQRLLTAHFDDGRWDLKERFSACEGMTLNLRAWHGNPMGEEFLVEKTGYLTPTRIELLSSDESPEVLYTDAPLIDTAAFEVQVHPAESRDGTKIDYFLLKPRHEARPGATPTLMTGYGGFGVCCPPGYFDRMVGGASLKLWLDRGGALAMPIIRGGGERGAAWHTAAIQINRQKSYDDFIAAAEDLIARGFTRSEHLGVFGFSHGGLLAATVGVQRPDLFSAVVSGGPTLDMLGHVRMGCGGGQTYEFGDLNVPEVRAAILGYSPYQNLRPGCIYPRFLVTVSTDDDIVGPGHARKFVARGKEIGAQVWLLEEPEGGHYLRIADPDHMALRMAFLIDTLMRPAERHA